ncbi:hypothetical protein IMZ48_41845 [Candidatus Bathyarchaeota archaeon]|nr:hypothetical protein [Candidatus Bathyarchaeota archaeon]
MTAKQVRVSTEKIGKEREKWRREEVEEVEMGERGQRRGQIECGRPRV